MKLTVGLKNSLDTVPGRSDLRRLHAFQEYLKSKDISDFCFREPQSPQTDYTLEFDGEELDRGDIDILDPVPVHYLYNFLTEEDQLYRVQFHEQWTNFTADSCKRRYTAKDPVECVIRPLLSRVIYDAPITERRVNKINSNWKNSAISTTYVLELSLEDDTVTSIQALLTKATEIQLIEIGQPLREVESKLQYTVNSGFVCFNIKRKALGTIHTTPITIDKEIEVDNKPFKLRSFIVYTNVHYIAYVNSDGTWFKHDDAKKETVTDIDSVLQDNTGVTVVMYSSDNIGDYDEPKQPLKRVSSHPLVCYRNAALQMLWSEPSIRAAIEEYKDKFQAYYEYIKFIE